MKKLISILLLICTITICLSSCGGSNDNSNNDNNNNDNTPTCDTTGVHTYEQGECTGCKLKVFDVLKDYIMENSTSSYGNTYRIAFGSYETDVYYGSIYYYSDKNYIEIGAYYQSVPGLSNPHIYNIGLRFTPYTFEDGGYEWSAGCTRLSCTCPSISGILDPSKFSSSTSTLEHTSSASGADDIAWKAKMALQGFIDNYLIDFTNNVGSNISIGSLGFKRYEQ